MHVRIALAFLVVGCASSGGSSGAASGEVAIDASKTFKGDVSLGGTITLPPGSGGGKSIQLTASGGGAEITQRGSYVAPAGSTPGESFPYTIRGLVPGKYTVRARVDQNGDGRLDTVGSDLDGQYGGTVAKPNRGDFGGLEAEVGANGATGVDFGLGVVK